jgi:hypothetical protein
MRKARLSGLSARAVLVCVLVDCERDAQQVRGQEAPERNRAGRSCAGWIARPQEAQPAKRQEHFRLDKSRFVQERSSEVARFEERGRAARGRRTSSDRDAGPRVEVDLFRTAVKHDGQAARDRGRPGRGEAVRACPVSSWDYRWPSCWSWPCSWPLMVLASHEPSADRPASRPVLFESI